MTFIKNRDIIYKNNLANMKVRKNMEYKPNFEELKKNDDEFYEKLSTWYYPEYKEFLENEGALPKEFEFIQNPFEEYLKHLGLDGLTNRSYISCWLALNENIDINEAVKICIDWKRLHLSYYEKNKSIKIPHIRNCEQGIRIVVDSNKELSEETLNICKDENIHFVVIISEDTLYDLVTQHNCSVEYEEYPGSADDAATYGIWYLR